MEGCMEGCTRPRGCVTRCVHPHLEPAEPGQQRWLHGRRQRRREGLHHVARPQRRGLRRAAGVFSTFSTS